MYDPLHTKRTRQVLCVHWGCYRHFMGDFALGMGKFNMRAAGSSHILRWTMICVFFALASFYARFFHTTHILRRSLVTDVTVADIGPGVPSKESPQATRQDAIVAPGHSQPRTGTTHLNSTKVPAHTPPAGKVMVPSAKTSDGNTTDLKPCSFEFRRERIEHQCRTAPPPRGNSLFANITQKQPGPALTSIVLDHERKIMGCLISKVSSTSWMAFLDKHTLIPHEAEQRQKRQRMKRKTLLVKKSFGVPLDDVNTKYKDYKKYIIVKHPMQRLVSAYYEAVVNRRMFDRISFDTFMERMASRELVGKNEHWALYSWWCYPCDVKYDYIIKMETFELDLPLINEAMGIDRDAKIPDINRNVFTNQSHARGAVPRGLGHDNIYRYEKELVEYRKKHPDIFDKVMEWYQPDMDMYGYDWNPTERSTCGFHSNKNTCC